MGAVIALKNVGELAEEEKDPTGEDTAINVIRQAVKEGHAVNLVINPILKNAKIFHGITLNTPIIILAYCFQVLHMAYIKGYDVIRKSKAIAEFINFLCFVDTTTTTSTAAPTPAPIVVPFGKKLDWN